MHTCLLPASSQACKPQHRHLTSNAASHPSVFKLIQRKKDASSANDAPASHLTATGAGRWLDPTESQGETSTSSTTHPFPEPEQGRSTTPTSIAHSSQNAWAAHNSQQQLGKGAQLPGRARLDVPPQASLLDALSQPLPATVYGLEVAVAAAGALSIWMWQVSSDQLAVEKGQLACVWQSWGNGAAQQLLDATEL